MAKKEKKKSSGTRTYDVVNLCACIALFITAFLYMTSWVFQLLIKYCSLTGLGSFMHLLQMIASIALLVAIALPAYRHVRSTANRRVWTICYWIALVVYICVVFLGFGFNVFGLN